MNKTYLGDSVYVESSDVNDFPMITLTTENGYGPSNTIILDGEVLDAFIAWTKRNGWKVA